MKFNINDNVRVKLTELGRQALITNHNEIYGSLPVDAIPPVPDVKEDEDGWSEWQLWHLMQELGKHIEFGSNPPFESEIEIVTE